MTKIGNVTQLSSLLAEKVASDRQLIEAQTSEQLRLHAESLMQLSRDALSTTTSAIEHQQKAIIDNLAALRKRSEQARQALVKATQGQQQALEEEIAAQTRRLLWLARWPILGTLAVCLLICLVTWAYWLATVPWTTERMSKGDYQIVKGDGWTLCNIGTPQQPVSRPCRPAR